MISMSRLYLVRHAKAGERRTWTGDDVDRPLSKKGWKQAARIADRLADLEPRLLLASPYVRCVQTLEPLAEETQLPVEIDKRLREYQPVEPLLELIADAPASTVLCSHGDLIPAAIGALRRAGAVVETPPDWRKASVWVLRRNRQAHVISAAVWPPPALGALRGPDRSVVTPRR